MNRFLFVRGLAVVAAAYTVLVIVAGGAIKPGYSQVSSFISELGATSTPYGKAFSIGGFLPIGLLIGAFLFAAAPLVQVRGASRAGYWLLLSQAVAYTVSAFAPCDAGCPAEGSITQNVHNLVAVLTYLAAGIGLFLIATAPALSRAAKSLFVVCGIAWLLAFHLMVAPELAAWRGLLQRVAEVILWSALFFIAFRMTAKQ